MSRNGLHIILLLFVCGFLCLSQIAKGQLSPSLYRYPNNQLPWYTIKSPHFRVHFQIGNSRTAKLTSQIAEHIYPEITSLYRFEPKTKIDIVLNDRQDYSNGVAYFFDNQVEIWVPSLNTPLRGTHDWLWDVITHEFTHIVQLQVAMKKSRSIPAVYFQWLSYSDVRRPDVLYGYPKGIITYPFASINVPAWLAEGVAQYQRRNIYFDYWDSHRDMLLRTALLAGEPMGFEDMGTFGSKNALQRERIYNQGFAFTSFLVDKYGEQILSDLSGALAQPSVFTVDKALKTVTGSRGSELFASFVEESRLAYKEASGSLNLSATTSVQEQGFYNFDPKTSPTKDKLAYLSNRKSRSSSLQLFIEDLTPPLQKSQTIDLGTLRTSFSRMGLHDRDPIIKQLGSTYSFAPDGSAIAFSRQKLNDAGEEYNDLFIYDLKKNKEKRITHSQRLSSPAWKPTKSKLIAIQQSRGSTNLVQIDIASSSVTPITNYQNSEQVYTPVWSPNGQKVYFSYSTNIGRDIYKLDLSTGKPEPVLQDSLTDFRDPHITSDGRYLYYSADPDGIFNIYRIALDQENSVPKKMTSVIGGAFMPHVSGQTLYFAEFKAEGYQIASVKITGKSNSNSPTDFYQQETLGYLKRPNQEVLTHPHFVDSTDAIPSQRIKNLGPTDSLVINFSRSQSKEPITLQTYQNTFTDFSFYPVIRFDNYTKKNGSNGRLLTAGQFGDLGDNLLRDLKIGTYFTSREVTGQLSVFGGAMFGIASEPSDGIGDFFSPARLTDLDRDLFLITQHQGLPFIKKRWSPTISLELYNLRRNVLDGLTVEEFPCTACLPDTTRADIAYTIWEADLFLRSKINAHNLIELGVGYSPYRIQTDGFFSRELQQFIPSASSEYFRSTTLTAAYVYENFLPYPNQDVAPVGLSTSLRYTYEPNRLLDDYEIEDGTLSPVYRSVKNHSLESTLRYGFPLGRHSSLSLYGRGFSYLNTPDDFFYLDYIGGFTGMRSYPYFAIGGNTTALAQLSYTFPLIRQINTQAGRHTLEKVYLRLFGETGNGWKGPLEIGNKLKTGAGAELRFAFNSYYLFPLKLFVSGAYGFNKFDVTLPDEFITNSTAGSVEYGQDLIFHFGLTFDFDVLNHD